MNFENLTGKEDIPKQATDGMYGTVLLIGLN